MIRVILYSCGCECMCRYSKYGKFKTIRSMACINKRDEKIKETLV